MFYFIPSWYGERNIWESPTVEWYLDVRKVEFDDTINQIRMFSKAKEPLKIVVLNYFPQLRYFLNRQDLYQEKYYSVFDDIQGIVDNSYHLFDFRDLNWDEDVEFVYTPFYVVAYVGEEVIATIEFGVEGNVTYINKYTNSKKEKIYYFDDRGFLSSVKYYENNNLISIEYLNRAGIWQIRQDFKHQCVVVNPIVKKRFNKLEYSDIKEIVAEFLEKYFKNITQNDALIVASNKMHNDLILKTERTNKKVLSYFMDRFNLTDNVEIKNDLSKVKFIIADSLSNEQKIKELVNKDNVYQLAPFDSRLRLGRSQREKYLKLLLLVDNLTDEDLFLVLTQLLELAEENKLIKIVLMSYQMNQRDHLKELIDSLLDKMDLSENYVFDDDKKQIGKNDIGIKKRDIDYIYATSEQDIIKELDSIRIVIDVRKNPDVFLQIACISAGIPQIDVVKTDYVENYKNGIVIDKIIDLKEAIKYYTVGLRHWNESLVYAANKIDEYTSGKIVEKWKELLEEKENGRN